MTNRIGLLSLLAAGLFCIAGSCRAATVECLAGTCGPVDMEINEPVFGYSYFPSQASFQRIRSESLMACLTVAKEHFFFSDGKISPWLYLYGEYQKEGTRLIIFGDHDGTSILVQRGQNCAVAPVVIAFLQRRSNPPEPGDTPYLSQQEIEDVFADLLRRYAAAFGGKAKFYAWLDPLTKSGLDECKGKSHAYCHPTWHDLPPDLQVMLATFRQDGNE